MREMICYDIGDITANVYLQFIALFAIMFYTSILGISAALAGLTLMESRISGGIDDIVVGYISDRHGHYKRRILYGPIATAVAFIIMFTNFRLSTRMQSVYALAIFYFWTLMYTCYTILFNAFTSTMTQNTEERTLLNSICFVTVTIPSLIISLVTSCLRSGTRESNNIYGSIALVFAVIAAVYTLVYVADIMERTRAPTARQHTSGKEYFRAIPKNRQLLVVSAAFFYRTFGYYIYSSSMTYYFNCYLDSAKLIGIILGISAPIPAVAALCVTPVSGYMDKKKALMGCGVIFALSSVIRYSISLNTAVVTVTCRVGIFVMNATLATFFTIIADTIGYDMWLTGRNVKAVNYGFCTFCQKIGTAFSDAIVGILLGMADYVPSQQQTGAALRDILNIYCLIPAAIYLIMTAFMLLRKLDEGRMHETMAELEIGRRLETSD